MHQGWPKFVLSAAHLVPSEGPYGGAARLVVVSGFAPSVSVLPDGSNLTILGEYPFSDNATIVPSATMALRLRVPCWCERAHVRVGADGAWAEATPCGFHSIAPTSERVLVVFENELRLHTWCASNASGQGHIEGGGIEVHRGALLYALRPSSSVNESAVPGAPPGSPIRARAVKVDTDSWNYALLPSSLRFESGAHPVPAVPFSSTASPPTRVLAKARRVPEWTSAGGARGVGPVPRSPLSSAEPLEDIELVPFGSTNVRISVFPTLVE